jgi:hypothetical protein
MLKGNADKETEKNGVNVSRIVKALSFYLGAALASLTQDAKGTNESAE